MEKNDAALTGEGALAPEDQIVSDVSDDEAPDDAAFQVEHEGRVYQLPGALRGGFLRHADYTRKTQELAAHRRALEAEREAVAAQAHAVGQASGAEVQLAALDHQLAAFQGVDWQGFAAQDPQGAEALWQRFEAMRQSRAGLAQAISHHATQSQLRAAREAAARMTETGRTLQKEIEGWSPEVAGKLVDYAQTHGVTLDELGQQDDPRVWKILHRAWKADQETERAGAAKTAAQAQTVRPAVMVSGSAAAGGGVRDELATKEWMKRRNDVVRNGR